LFVNWVCQVYKRLIFDIEEAGVAWLQVDQILRLRTETGQGKEYFVNLGDVKEYYALYDEESRLLSEEGQLEFERTKDIIKRFIPAPPGSVADIGGATGRYSYWLTSLGYESHLVDLSPVLVEKARKAAANYGGTNLASCEVGDARELKFRDNSLNAVLSMGPLYHLTEASERMQSLREVHRVLNGGGVLFAAGISRFASAVYGLMEEAIIDTEIKTIIEQDLATGQHRNTLGKVENFTSAYFHQPLELKAEVEEAGFSNVKIFAVEGIALLIGHLHTYMQDAQLRGTLLKFLRLLESEPALLGATSHLMCVGYKKQL